MKPKWPPKWPNVLRAFWVVAAVAWTIGVIHVGSQSRVPFEWREVSSWTGYASVILVPVLGIPIVIWAFEDVVRRIVRTIVQDFVPEKVRKAFRKSS